MSKKPDPYLKKAELLRKYGFKITYGKRGHKKAGDKSNVTRQWKKIKNYAEGDKQRFRFFKADTKTKKKIQGVLAPIQVAPAGFFFRIPNGAKKFKIKLNGKNVEVEGTGVKGGKRREVYVKLDPIDIAKDPVQAVKKHFPKFKKDRNKMKARVVVAGYDGRRDYPAEYFLNYMPEMVSQLLDPEREGDESFARRRIATNKRALKPKDISDIFHIKLEFQTPSNYAKRSKKVQSKRKGKRK
jgi:hypothetical protein